MTLRLCQHHRVRLAALLGVCNALAACPDRDRPPPQYNQPLIGAPALRHEAPPVAPPQPPLPTPPRVLEEHLPEEAARQFPTLEAMSRSPRWNAFADLIRSQVKQLYARGREGKHKPPHDIAITQYFIRKMPEVYGVDFVAWCGADYGGPLSYVENHLLVVRQKGALEVLTAHRPTCGSVGDRSVYFSDLVADGKDELIEVYVEDTAVGDDVQEIRVFSMVGDALRRIAALRASSPVKFFHHEFRQTPQGNRDIVTTHIEIEKALARLRKRPCWMYRYFEVETVYRYKAEAKEYVVVGTTRRRLAQNVALDLTGTEAPEGSCGG